MDIRNYTIPYLREYKRKNYQYTQQEDYTGFQIFPSAMLQKQG